MILEFWRILPSLSWPYRGRISPRALITAETAVISYINRSSRIRSRRSIYIRCYPSVEVFAALFLKSIIELCFLCGCVGIVSSFCICSHFLRSPFSPFSKSGRRAAYCVMRTQNTNTKCLRFVVAPAGYI